MTIGKTNGGAGRSYSPQERAVLTLMKRHKLGRRYTTFQIIEVVYPEGDAPVNARQAVAAMMIRLTDKVARNKEKFHIRKSKWTGGRGAQSEYWRETAR